MQQLYEYNCYYVELIKEERNHNIYETNKNNDDKEIIYET